MPKFLPYNLKEIINNKITITQIPKLIVPMPNKYSNIGTISLKNIIAANMRAAKINKISIFLP
jgi:hypothetical protein